MTLYAVQWSDYQQCYHIEPIHEAMKANLIQFLSGQPIQYSIISVSQTREEAAEFQRQAEMARSAEMNARINR